MMGSKTKQDVVARLNCARNEIEEVLRFSAPAGRYDPVLLRSAARNELSLLCTGLARIIGEVQGEQ